MPKKVPNAPIDWIQDGGRMRLLQYCLDNDFPHELSTYDLADGREWTSFGLRFHAETVERVIYVFSDQSADRLLQNDFAKYQFLNDYYAIYSPDQHTIEALVHHSYSHIDTMRILSGGEKMSPLLTALGDRNEFLGEPFSIEQPSQSRRKLRVSIGIQSQASLAFDPIPGQLSLKIENVDIAGCAPSDVLKQISTSLFFEIDTALDLTLSLKRSKKIPFMDFATSKRQRVVEFPQYAYETGPVSLYLYGRRAGDFPLLQFLAFYQVLEYFFPQYAEAEAIRNVKSALTEVGFMIERLSDIKRLQAVCNRALGPKEVNQLNSTLEQCVSDKELHEYLHATDERKRFFSERHPSITGRHLRFGPTQIDLRSEVSELVYDIRCRIVHTKAQESDPDQAAILPDSSQADMIVPFVDLVRFLAQRAIARSASKLSL